MNVNLNTSTNAMLSSKSPFVDEFSTLTLKVTSNSKNDGLFPDGSPKKRQKHAGIFSKSAIIIPKLMVWIFSFLTVIIFCHAKNTPSSEDDHWRSFSDDSDTIANPQSVKISSEYPKILHGMEDAGEVEDREPFQMDGVVADKSPSSTADTYNHSPESAKLAGVNTADNHHQFVNLKNNFPRTSRRLNESLSPANPQTPTPTTWPPTTFIPTPFSTTMSPTKSTHPTLSSSPSENPTSSLPPSTSSQPSPECMDLTISLFLPSMTYATFELYIAPVGKDGEDDNDDAVWEIFYDDPNCFEEPHEIFDTKYIIEHSNGTNSFNEAVCLPRGSYVLLQWCTFCTINQGCEFLEETAYVISSNGQKIACGVGLANNTIYFDLPLEDQLSSASTDGNSAAEDAFLVESGCTQPQCTPGNEGCLRREFDALDCYYSAYLDGYDVIPVWMVDGKNVTIDRGAWFDETCSQVLADACNGGGGYLGFNDEMRTEEMDRFCDYYECALSQDPTTGATVTDHPKCSCLYDMWYCHRDGYFCEWGYMSDVEESLFDCCSQENDVLTNSCKCSITHQCKEVGDAEFCEIGADYCCADEEACKLDFHQQAQNAHLQNNGEGDGMVGLIESVRFFLFQFILLGSWFLIDGC